MRAILCSSLPDLGLKRVGNLAWQEDCVHLKSEWNGHVHIYNGSTFFYYLIIDILTYINFYIIIQLTIS